MKFTVFRDSWARGASEGKLYADGERCCLGFLGLACGLADREMAGLGSPEDVAPQRWPQILVSLRESDDGEAEYRDSALCEDIICVNDDEALDDSDREASLRRMFASGGIEVEFQDGVGP